MGFKVINIFPVTVSKSSYDAIFVTPRRPILEIFKHVLGRGEEPITILRLWSIRAAKLRDNLQFGAYEDILVFVSSLLANLVYIAACSYSIAIDYATYVFARRVYIHSLP